MSDPTDFDLTTVDDVRSYMGGSGVLPVSDANNNQIQFLITAYSRACSTYCSRDFRLREYNETYNGVAGQGLSLRQGPIQSVSSLNSGGCNVNASPSLNQPGFIVSGDFMLYLRWLYFAPGVQNVQVSYMAGYFTPGMALLVSPPDFDAIDLPQDLQESVIEAVSYRYRRAPNDDKAALNISGNAGTSYTNYPIPPGTKMVWDAYKRALLWP